MQPNRFVRISLAVSSAAFLTCVAHRALAEDRPEVKVTPKDLVGTWEKRDQYGSDGKTATAELEIEEGGVGAITIKLNLPGKSPAKRIVHSSMRGLLDWSVKGSHLSLKYSDWRNEIDGINVSGTEADFVAIGDDYMIFQDSEEGDLTVRYRKKKYSVKALGQKSFRVMGLFELSGSQAFRIEPEGSIQMVGEPAVVEWTDPTTGMINYLIAKQIEFFKPGRFFHASGGPVLIDGGLMFRNESSGSRIVLFDNLDDLVEDGTTVLAMPNRKPGTELSFRRGEKPKPDPPTPAMEKIAGTWFRTTKPNTDGQFFHIQRTFNAEDRTVTGFISIRATTANGLTREKGRILMFGTWFAEGKKLEVSTDLYLPRHPELGSGEKSFTVRSVQDGKLNLVDKDGEEIILKATNPGETTSDAPDSTVNLWEPRIKNPGW